MSERETDEQVVARLVGFRVRVATGREGDRTYDHNPRIVIEHTEEEARLNGPYRLELRRYETWALVRLLLAALEEHE